MAIAAAGTGKYRPYGNNLIILHPDGSRSGYWHLQKDGALVNVGDTVKQGQVIGLSGKTGYAFQPHLHFMVWASGNGQLATNTHKVSNIKRNKISEALKKYQQLQATSIYF